MSTLFRHTHTSTKERESLKKEKARLERELRQSATLLSSSSKLQAREECQGADPGFGVRQQNFAPSFLIKAPWGYFSCCKQKCKEQCFALGDFLRVELKNCRLLTPEHVYYWAIILKQLMLQGSFFKKHGPKLPSPRTRANIIPLLAETTFPWPCISDLTAYINHCIKSFHRECKPSLREKERQSRQKLASAVLLPS